MGVPVRTTAGSTASQTSRPCWRLLVPGRDVRQGRRCLCYLYRAIDRDGRLIDSMLSEGRDKHAARRFLRRLIDVAGAKLLRVTTDHHPAYRKAMRWILGRKVLHRTNQ